MAEKPEEVFRFVNLRPVQRIDPEREKRQFARYGEGRSPLHAEIAGLTGERRRDRAIELARRRLEKADPDPKELARLHAAVGDAAGKPDAAAARQAVRDALGAEPSQFLSSTAGRKLRDAVWDRVYAHGLAPEVKPEERDALLAGARDLHFLSFLAGQADEERPLGKDALASVSPVIPKDAVPPLDPREREDEKRYREMARKGLDEVHGRMEKLNLAMADLRDGDRRVRARDQRVLVSFPIVTTEKIVRAEQSQLGGPSAVGRERALAVTTGPGAPRTARAAKTARRGTEATREAASLQEQVQVVPRMQPWIHTDEGRRNLAAGTQELLAAAVAVPLWLFVAWAISVDLVGMRGA